MMRRQSKAVAVKPMTEASPKPKRGPKAQPSATSIGYLVRKAHQAFIWSLELRLAPFGLSSSMYFFLRLLWEKDGLTQKEISEELGLTPPTTVAAMDNLESKGFIVRSRNTEDRRKVNIYLTRRGRDLEGKLRPRAAEVNAAALKGISPADVELVAALLTQMMESLAVDLQTKSAAKSKAE